MKPSLKRLGELEGKATKGPWTWDVNPGPDETDCARLLPGVCDFGNAEQYYPTCGAEPSEADMAIIAESRNALPALLRIAVEAQKLSRWEIQMDVTHGLVMGPQKRELIDVLANLRAALAEVDP